MIPRSKTWRVVLVTSALVLAWAAWLTLAWLWPPPKLVIGRDTTWLSGPLDADGSVDYVAAWRAEHSPGVTEQNNAAPLVYAALGFDLSPFTDPERAAAPKVERPFEEFYDWAKTHRDELAKPTHPKGDAEDETYQSLDAGDLHGPQERAIAAWLDSIAPSLAVLEEATHRERFYASDGAPRSEGIARYWEISEVARTLARRAHRRANAGDFGAACTDLCTALRLAQLVRSMGGLIHIYVATGCESYLWPIAAAIADEHSPLPVEFVQHLFAARDPTPPESTISSALTSLRISSLRASDYLRLQADTGPLKILSRLDPNRFNRRLNAWDDRLEAAWSDPRGWSARIDATDSLHAEAIVGARSKSADRAIPTLLRGPSAATDLIADHWAMMQIETTYELDEFIGDVATADRLLAEMAVATFQKQFDLYPKSSDDLTPFVFPVTFRDRLTKSGVTFRRDERGRLVASGPLVDLLSQIESLKERFKQRSGQAR